MLDLDYFLSLPSYLEFLGSTRLPIFIWGMGDGCLKLLNIFNDYGIPCAGIFASDEFVRDKLFMGYRLHSLSEIENAVPEFIVVLAFGAGYPELMRKIEGLSLRHRLIVPDMPVVGGGLFTKDFLVSRFDSLSRVYSMLSDQKSREVYKALIEFKITGEIKTLRSCETHPSDGYRLLKIGASESVFDLGAYTGDTIRELLDFTGGSFSSITGIEPDRRNFRKLCEYVERSGLDNSKVRLINAAAGDSCGSITVLKGGGRMIKRSQSGVSVQMISLDSLFWDNASPEDSAFRECTYIKYDIEGEEQNALYGSKRVLKMFKPSICCSIYHRLEDIYSIPLYISSCLPGHRLYIRHSPCYPAWDTSLYATDR